MVRDGNTRFTRGRSSPLPLFTNLNTLIRSHMYDSSLPMLLRFEDRCSMAHAIESRLPFLDHRLVELGVGLGSEFKIIDGETKWLVRRAMSGVLPPAVRDRQDKIGFSTPELEWLTGSARKIVHEGTEEALRRFPGVFQADSARRLRDDILDGRKAYDAALWRIAVIGIWGRVFEVRP